jgi:uncharacterized protein (TIGR03085 family)
VVTYLAAGERTALCALALQVGPTAPTLCEGWDVRDLVAHLVLRDGSLAAVGIVLPPLSGLADRGMESLVEKHSFEDLVERLRKGPPRHSPFRIKAVDRLLNAMEYYIHHEDIRRAQPSWQPRELSSRVQDALWQGVRSSGRALLRSAEVGVVASRPDTSSTVVLKAGEPSVTVHGLPAEVALFVFGRKGQAQVKLHGEPRDVALLKDTSLGI